MPSVSAGRGAGRSFTQYAHDWQVEDEVRVAAYEPFIPGTFTVPVLLCM